MLINVKMPTIAGILTFISIVSKISESLIEKKSYFKKANQSPCTVELSMEKVLQPLGLVFIPYHAAYILTSCIPIFQPVE